MDKEKGKIIQYSTKIGNFRSSIKSPRIFMRLLFVKIRLIHNCIILRKQLRAVGGFFLFIDVYNIYFSSLLIYIIKLYLSNFNIDINLMT